jgi:hypothetical protein
MPNKSGTIATHGGGVGVGVVVGGGVTAVFMSLWISATLSARL